MAAGDPAITCNGNNTITIEKIAPVEKVGILSNFLSSSVLGDNTCSAEQAEVDRINREIDRYGRDIQRLNQESDELFEKVQDLANKYNSYKDKRSAEAQQTLADYNREYEYYQSVSNSNNDETVRIAGLRETYRDMLSDLKDDLSKAEKALEDCQNKPDDDTTSGTDTT